MDILMPVSAGTLIDQITILSIKSRRIPDADKRAVVGRELQALSAVRDRIPELTSDAARELERQLVAVNEALWDIEDEIRALEAEKNFGARFIEVARSVYFTNERRVRLKREIDRLAGSAFWEEKSFSKPV